jgi:FlaA1/EpsC-like NDP-sugar epimerase
LQEEGVGEKATIIPIIGDLKDRDYIRFILGRLKADVVFHAAAYKHVPMMEENPVAAIENNVLGTDNLITAAVESGVKRFVLISTDKAVDPVSVYGASKQLCERLVLEAGQKAPEGHSFMVVRFGNVLGSRGSIMPLFQKQIEKGGPVTVTHPDATRWFMTIPEACSLVLKAGGVGDNGKLYLLDMGDPVRIRDLAEQMIKFYGFEPEKDIRIEYIGLRSGERLDERLWGEEELPVDTEYPRIRRVALRGGPAYDLAQLLKELKPICRYDPSNGEVYRDRTLLRAVLRRAVPTVMIDKHERPF